MECVDLKDSDDVMLDEVLCVEKFKVNVFCSFASAFSCSNALACCGVCVRRFSLLQMLVSSRKFLRCSPSGIKFRLC